MSFSKEYIEDLRGVLAGIDAAMIDSAIHELQRAGREGKFVYACGNGGSASIASQMVADLVKGASMERVPRFKMLSLVDSISTVTAYANDVGYESVFVEQLKNFASEGDVLIAISGSGNSENVLRAVDYANSVGCKTIGLTTGHGGKLRELAAIPILVPSGHMGRLEDSFFVVTHILVYAFMEKRY